MKPALHLPLRVVLATGPNTPKVRLGKVSTQLSVPASLTCSLSVIVKLGECNVALIALKELFAVVAGGGGLGGGGLPDGGWVMMIAAPTTKDCWTGTAG